jgi:uncharacterized protein YdbL (DUF1318 family)
MDFFSFVKSLKPGKKWVVYGLLLVLAVAASLATHNILTDIKTTSGEKVGTNFFYLISSVGALGGILFSTKNRLLELPHDDSLDRNKFSLGFIADILGGIGGAYVIFLLLPFEFHKVSINELDHINPVLNGFEQIRILIQVIAISLIGGYGGRALIEQVQTELLKQELDRKLDIQSEKIGEKIEVVDNQLRERLNQVEQELSTRKESERINSRALVIARTMLQEIGKSADSQEREEELKMLLNSSSPSTRETICIETTKIRDGLALKLRDYQENEKNGIAKNVIIQEVYTSFYENNKTELTCLARSMATTSLVFDSLLNAVKNTDASSQDLAQDINQERKEFEHRYEAQLAYAKKDILYCKNLQYEDASKKEWKDILNHCNRSEAGTPQRSNPSLIAHHQATTATTPDDSLLRDPAAVMASPRRGDGQSRPAPGTARHRGPVAAGWW